MRAEGLEGASFVFNQIAKNRHDSYFLQTKYCTAFVSSKNSSILDREGKGTMGYEDWLEKSCQQFSLQRRKKECWNYGFSYQWERFCKDKNTGFACRLVALWCCTKAYPYGYCWCNVNNWENGAWFRTKCIVSTKCTASNTRSFLVQHRQVPSVAEKQLGENLCPLNP